MIYRRNQAWWTPRRIASLWMDTFAKGTFTKLSIRKSLDDLRFRKKLKPYFVT